MKLSWLKTLDSLSQPLRYFLHFCNTEYNASVYKFWCVKIATTQNRVQFILQRKEAILIRSKSNLLRVKNYENVKQCLFRSDGSRHILYDPVARFMSGGCPYVLVIMPSRCLDTALDMHWHGTQEGNSAHAMTRCYRSWKTFMFSHIKTYQLLWLLLFIIFYYTTISQWLEYIASMRGWQVNDDDE
jgi:hypothetical protein